jgi:Holliday junction resolvase RusA-like endonuclease
VKEITFTLNTIPVAKGRPRFAVRGRFAMAYTPKKTRDAEEQIKILAMPYRPTVPIDVPIELEVLYFMPIPSGLNKAARIRAESEIEPHIKKPDVDNLLKSFDALSGIFWTDDSRIYKITATKLYSPRPRIEVKMRFAEASVPCAV